MVRHLVVSLSLLFSASTLYGSSLSWERNRLPLERNSAQGQVTGTGGLENKIDSALRMSLSRAGSPGKDPKAVSTVPGQEKKAIDLLAVLSARPDGGYTAPVVVRAAGGDVEGVRQAIESVGGTWSTVSAGRVAARVPAEAIEELAAYSVVDFIEASVPLSQLMDLSRPEIKADAVQAGTGLPQAYKGKGVVVGVVDSGIDWTHPDFKDASGKSRILYLWDQSRDGKSPAGFSHGWEYSNADLDSGMCVERDGTKGVGHGTHVTGTAAGSGAGASGLYRGIAPEADIVFVKIGSADSATLTGNYLEGADYVFRKAAALGRPAVVNLSLGTLYGPHDGTSDSEVALDGLAGAGRVVVASNGNSGGTRIHAGFDAAGNSYETGYSVMAVPSTLAGTLGATLYARGGSISVGVQGWKKLNGTWTRIVSTAAVPKGSQYARTRLTYGSATVGYVEISASGATRTGDQEVVVIIDDNGDPFVDIATTMEWEIYTYGSGHIDGWVFTGGAFSPEDDRANGWVGGDTAFTVGSPATSTRAIAVGSYATRSRWTDIDGKTETSTSTVVNKISSFSSLGPTRDGRRRPVVSAPGEFIIAPLSDAIDVTRTDVRPYVLAGATYRTMAGTSMSGPHVTGLVALMLQASSQLSPEETARVLQETARKDSYTGVDSGNTWGAGKVDALAAMKVVAVPPPPSYLLSSSPASLSVRPGAPASLSVKVAADTGFSANVTLSVAGLPAGALASFSVPTIPSPGSGSSVLTVSVSSAVLPGTYILVVNAAGGGLSKNLEVPCTVSPAADAMKLLLLGGRVAVSVAWRSQYSGASGTATGLPQKDEFGFFYFEDANNPEVFVKVLDFGSARPYLLFWAGLTDFEYTVTFENVATGKKAVYLKPAGSLNGGASAVDLPQGRSVISAASSTAPPEEAFYSRLLADGMKRLSAYSSERKPEAATTLLLSRGRISVSLTWRNQYSGASGSGSALAQKDEFGFFYFTDPNNPEVFVKVLDFGSSRPFLLFWAGLTDLEYTVTFTNVATGQTATKFKPAGSTEGGADTSQMTWTAPPPPPTVAFTFAPTNPLPAQVVNFTNQTSNATSYLWEFGDDTTSTASSPSKAYAAEGTYQVRLTATNPGGSSSVVHPITVRPPLPEPNFSFSPTSPFVGQPVTFQNQSRYAASYYWEFGDGTTSTSANPVKSYGAAGSFPVRLTASNSSGSQAQTITITVRTAGPMTVSVWNRLVKQVTVQINGNWKGYVPSGSVGTFDVVTAGSTVRVDVETQVAEFAGGGEIPGSGTLHVYWDAIPVVPSTNVALETAVYFPSSGNSYFSPLMSNATFGPVEEVVNLRLSDEFRCNCNLPPGGADRHYYVGYYKLHSNSVVAAFQNGGYPYGHYIYWNNLGSYWNSASGAVLLTLTTPPVRTPGDEVSTAPVPETISLPLNGGEGPAPDRRGLLPDGAEIRLQ